MDFTTKNILNYGRLILSIISHFLNSMTCLIMQYSNGNIATFSSKFESLSSSSSPSSPAITTTTKTPSIFSSLFDSTPYSSPWMYSTSGDLIGTESGVFMASASELEQFQQQYHDIKSNLTKRQPKKKLKKEYPPTIPSWRGKLPGDFPWSLSRHYVDGRLVLKEERMEYYEYLEATRENGRLVLNLLVLKGKIKCHDQHNSDNTIEEEITYDDIIDRHEKEEEEKKTTIILIQEDIQIKHFPNEDEMTSNSSLLVVA